MGGRDDVELAVLDPAGEACAEAVIRRDREDALEDLRGERRLADFLSAQLPLGALDAALKLFYSDKS